MLKRQAADVDAMLAAMAQQLAQLTAAYREELESVERVLMQVCVCECVCVMCVWCGMCPLPRSHCAFCTRAC